MTCECPAWRRLTPSISCRVSLTVLAAAVLVSGCIARPEIYPHMWEARGQVVSASATAFAIRVKTGEVYTLAIDDGTRFEREKQPATWQSLLRGTRVEVDIESVQAGVFHARRVRVFGGGRPW